MAMAMIEPELGATPSASAPVAPSTSAPLAQVPRPGRGTSFDEIFLISYGRLVRSVTVVCGGDAEAAADCVADAFERAFVRWRRVSRLEDPVGWIRRVAINRAIDQGRRRRRRDRAVERLSVEHGGESSTDEGIESAGGADTTLTAAVATLSRQQRAVVALFYVDDLTVAEVAATMELSEGAVKYHLHQARERLRSIWDPGDAGNTGGHRNPRDGGIS
jgi:RNA polymerase sigma-70 factor (ECF subfamily)